MFNLPAARLTLVALTNFVAQGGCVKPTAKRSRAAAVMVVWYSFGNQVTMEIFGNYPVTG